MKKSDPLLYIGGGLLVITAALNIIRIIISPSNIYVPIVNLLAVAGGFIFICLTLNHTRNRWLQIGVLLVAQSAANAVCTAADYGAKVILLLFLAAFGVMISCVWIFKKKRMWVTFALIAEVLIVIGSVLIAGAVTGTLNKITVIISMPITWLCMIVIYIRRQLEKAEGITDISAS